MAKATDFKTSDKTTNSLFKGAGFNKSQPAQPAPASTPTPQPAQSMKQKGSEARSSGGESTEGQEVEFDGLDDVDKQCYALAAKSYNGKVDPKQWAMYWAQKNQLPMERLLVPAQYIANIVRNNNLVSAEEIDGYKYPWWSAARDWSPNAIGAMGNKMNNAFTPSSELVDALTSRF